MVYVDITACDSLVFKVLKGTCYSIIYLSILSVSVIKSVQVGQEQAEANGLAC